MSRSVTIVGRRRERQILLATLRAVADGGKRALTLIGTPGIGKSTLLALGRAEADQRGFVTALVRVPPVPGVPHAPLLPLALETRRQSARVGLDPPRALHAAIDTMSGRSGEGGDPVMPLVAEALERIAARAPIAWFIDDWHRASDEVRADLLAVVRAVDAPFLMVTACPDAARETLPAATADLWVDELAVEGLSHDEVTELAERCLGGRLLPSLSEALTRVTMTNPLYIEEVLRAWADAGMLTEVGGHWGVGAERSVQAPSSLAALIAARVAALPDRTRAVARAVAVVGREMTFEDVAAVTGVQPAELAAVLSESIAAGMLAEIDGPPLSYRIAHPTYEQALLDGLTGTARGLLHQRAYQGLLARRAGGHEVSDAEIASHALRALERPGDLDGLVRAAAREASATRRLEDAARWWEHAATLARTDGARSEALHGQAVATMGFDARASVGLLSEALALTTDEHDARTILMRRAEAHRIAGNIAEAIDDLERALAGAPDEERFEIRSRIARMHASLGELARAEQMLHELEAEAPQGVAYVRVMADLASVHYTYGDVSAVAAYLARATAEADEETALHIQGNDMWIRLVTGDWDAAKRMSDSLAARADRAGDLWNVELPLSVGARISAWRGEIGAALDLARRAVRVAERLGNRADLVDATEALTIALLEAGTPGEAVIEGAKIERLVDRGVESRPDLALSFVVAGEAWLAAGDSVAARAMAERARSFVGPTLWGVAVDRLEAEVRLKLRDRPAALEWVRPWLDDPSPLPFEQARIHEVAARALFLLGESARGAEHADVAIHRYTALEVAGRLERFARVVATHRPRKVGRPRSNLPGGLTERETEVLHLVLQGLTNPQIAEVLTVSVHTAKKHVENIIAKAGVHRRTELLGFAERVGIRFVVPAEPST